MHARHPPEDSGVQDTSPRRRRRGVDSATSWPFHLRKSQEVASITPRRRSSRARREEPAHAVHVPGAGANRSSSLPPPLRTSSTSCRSPGPPPHWWRRRPKACPLSTPARVAAALGHKRTTLPRPPAAAVLLTARQARSCDDGAPSPKAAAAPAKPGGCGKPARDGRAKPQATAEVHDGNLP